MTISADEMIDRRRLRRKLAFWRIAFVAVAIVGIVIGSSLLSGDSFLGKFDQHIARVRIDGTITEDEDLLARLEQIRKSPAVKGVIVSIDSPGGTTAGGEAIFEGLRKLAADKPVVAQIGTLGASAGYMVASACDHIVARKSSIVGSIGVIVQFPNVSGLMEKLGIDFEQIKSSPLKAEPSPFSPTTEEARAMIRTMILDSYDWFVGTVEQRRNLTRQEVLALSDGSVYTGRQALDKKLVDALGGEQEAVEWLKSKGVDSELKIIEWKPKPAGANLLFSGSFGHYLAGLFGLSGEASDIFRRAGGERIFLDGLLSVWHVENPVASD